MLLTDNKSLVIFLVLISVEMYSVAPMTDLLEVTNSEAELARTRRGRSGSRANAGIGAASVISVGTLASVGLFSKSEKDRPPANPANTGNLYMPNKSTRAPPPKIEEHDPKDSEINKAHSHHGAKVYDQNPCEKYNENSYTRPNSKRKNGCKNAPNNFIKKAKEFPSPRCPDLGEGRCFGYENMTGRCALLVNLNDPAKIRYEFIFNCVE